MKEDISLEGMYDKKFPLKIIIYVLNFHYNLNNIIMR